MKILRPCSWLLAFLLFPSALLKAEKVADLPMPTRYVEDFAGVLDPQSRQQIEDLCTEVHNQANADLEVVTIKSLDDGETIEDFTVSLEEKWKIGRKGIDRSALIVLVLNPHKLRIETGYGLEGILPDAEIGRILDQASPDATRGDYGDALLTIVQQTSHVIANDAHVELTPITHTYHQEVVQDQHISMGQIIGAILIFLIVVILIATGHGGWLLWILINMIGGRGGGGGGGGGDSGGGFGGSGGGESGGGGASRDF